MTMPKRTNGWCRRKERRGHRRGKIGPLDDGWISTKSRSHPWVVGTWSEFGIKFIHSLEIVNDRSSR